MKSQCSGHLAFLRLGSRASAGAKRAQQPPPPHPPTAVRVELGAALIEHHVHLPSGWVFKQGHQHCRILTRHLQPSSRQSKGEVCEGVLSAAACRMLPAARLSAVAVG